MTMQELAATAHQVVVSGKGILATDESDHLFACLRGTDHWTYIDHQHRDDSRLYFIARGYRFSVSQKRTRP